MRAETENDVLRPDGSMNFTEKIDDKWFAHSLSGKERNRLFRNSGGTAFTDASTLSGLDSIADGRGFAHWDFDRDGWPDLALVNANQPALEIFRNQLGESSTNNVIAFRFVGGNGSPTPMPEWSPRDPIGVVVSLRIGEKTIERELRAGEGYAAQNSRTLLIGIGAADHADSVEIRWPSGRRQRLGEVVAGGLLTAHENPENNPGKTAFERAQYRP